MEERGEEEDDDEEAEADVVVFFAFDVNLFIFARTGITSLTSNKMTFQCLSTAAM